MGISSKGKGNRGEKEVVELLKKYWKDKGFTRSPESGGLATMMEGYGVPEDIVGRLAGDILVPNSFPFCVESKLYAEIDLYQLIRNPTNCLMLQWWMQCKDDARKAKKIPLLTFRENRKKRYVALAVSDFDALRNIQTKNGKTTYFESGHIITTLLPENGYENIIILSWEDFVMVFPKESIL